MTGRHEITKKLTSLKEKILRLSWDLKKREREKC